MAREYFLSEQRISWLDAKDPVKRLEAIVSGSLPTDLDRGVGRKKEEAKNSPWKNLQRADLVQAVLNPGQQKGAPKSWQRVVVVCPAGLGKTTNMRYMNAHLNDPKFHRGQLTVFVDLARLAKHPHLLADPEELLKDIEIRELRKRANADASPRNPFSPHRSLIPELRRIMRRGKLMLLLDGLDQTAIEVDDLRNFLEHWEQCPVWISSRPPRVGEYWPVLFNDPQWEFLRVEPLDDATIKKSMRFNAGWEYFDKISPSAQRLLSIPRQLRLFNHIAKKAAKETPAQAQERVAQMEKLQTSADVYHVAYFHLKDPNDADRMGLLASGLRAEGADKLGRYMAASSPPLRKQVERAGEILGAIAFEMFVNKADPEGPPGETPAPNRAGVASKDLNEFHGLVAQRLAAARRGNEGMYVDDLKCLKQMSANSLELIFGDTDREWLYWTDPTVQAYFAAWWATKYEQPEKLKVLRRWLVDPFRDETAVYREFWAFATEMPAAEVNPTTWEAALRPLYVPPKDSKNRPIRSCEMLFRSWQRMDRLQTEKKHAALIDRWRNDLWLPFKAEYPTLLQTNPILQKLEAGFVPLTGGEFTMGDDEEYYDNEKPAHRVRVKSFQMHRYAVTNAEYECFDPYHRTQRWHGSKDGSDDESHPLWQAKKGVKGDDRCPVVNVDWYMAWSFAQWTGSRLPSEPQWEYACRKLQEGTTPEPYNIKGHVGKELHNNYCNYSFEYGHTLAVDALGENEAGLWQMHGNVWERCWDWYDERVYHRRRAAAQPVYLDSNGTDVLRMSRRVLRGGSWGNSAGNCRSAFRAGAAPDLRYDLYGFRLSRTVSV